MVNKLSPPDSYHVNVNGEVEPFCCWLRPSPPGINCRWTYNRILEAIRIQQRSPPNCHYCKYRPKHVDDFERHVVQGHPGRPAYLGPTPMNIAKALNIIETIEEDSK